MEGRKGLFNDALNTFCLWLCGVRRMAKDHSARDETHCHHCIDYTFQLAARDPLFMHHPTNRIAHTPALEH